MGSQGLCSNLTETASSRLRDTASKQGGKQQYLGLHSDFYTYVHTPHVKGVLGRSNEL